MNDKQKQACGTLFAVCEVDYAKVIDVVHAYHLTCGEHTYQVSNVHVNFAASESLTGVGLEYLESLGERIRNICEGLHQGDTEDDVLTKLGRRLHHTFSASSFQIVSFGEGTDKSYMISMPEIGDISFTMEQQLVKGLVEGLEQELVDTDGDGYNDTLRISGSLPAVAS